MYKKCLFFVHVLLVFEVRCDCDGYFGCFNDFLLNFFNNNADNEENISTNVTNLPEDFVQVKDVKFDDVHHALTDISSFLRDDITQQLVAQTNSAIFQNVNPKTKIFVKTFSYNNPVSVVRFLDNIDLQDSQLTIHDDNKEEESSSVMESNKKQVIIEDRSSFSVTTLQTITNAEEGIVENENSSNRTEKQLITEEYSSSPIFTTQTTKKSAQLKTIKNQKDVRENEISNDEMESYYDSQEDNSTDYPVIDYVEMYKDTTNEENIYEPTTVGSVSMIGMNKLIQVGEVGADGVDTVSTETESVRTIYPWIATIFIKNDSKSNQFDYYCDGTLLTERVIITAARCVSGNNSSVDPQNVLVMLGKTSLTSVGDNEKAVRINQIKTHENFTNDNGTYMNDVALLLIEEPVTYNEVIQPAFISNSTDDQDRVDKRVTTAWNLQGNLVPVYLEKIKCENGGDNFICATYGNDVALCPSYGGVLASKNSDGWSVEGIRTADVTDRGLCFDKRVTFMRFDTYAEWIDENST